MLQASENSSRSIRALVIMLFITAIAFVTLYYSVGYQAMQIEENVELEPAPPVTVHQVTVRSGDNLTKVFHAVGLDDKAIASISGLGEKAKPLYHLKPKQHMTIAVDEAANRCVNLVLWLSDTEKVECSWEDDHYQVERVTQALEQSTNYAKIVVKRSLLEDALKVGVGQHVIYQLTEALGWEIDFIKDLRPGDTFTLLYQQIYVPEKGYVDGDLEEVIFTHKSGELRADKFTNSKGGSAFYLPDGRRLSRDFLVRPLKYTRVSSPFTLSRKHPLLGITRPHHGVDLAAKYGSPIWSTGQGRVVFVGNKSGYGKTVVIQHNHQYKTLYAHLSKFAKNLKVGGRVKQGEIIGYVGMTGITTGPHLHYELRVHNKPVNPFSIKIPRSPSLSKKDLPAFQALLERYDGIRTQMQKAREEA
jgi:murein DD-endopeptidase MepM/ murein hydrolase activator NlpD